MPYTITHTNGQLFATINDGVLNDDLGISLIGQDYHNYGQIMNNNLLRLVEHQANNIPPVDPVPGQLWWDTNNQVMKFFDGQKFKSCGISTPGVTAPLSPKEGDQWWDVINGQLKVFTGTLWEVIGPNYVKGQSFSGLSSTVVSDTANNAHNVAPLLVSGTVIAIASKDPTFTMSAPINGISVLAPGLTLAPNIVITGSTTDSLALGGVAASNYVSKVSALNEMAGNLVINGSSGVSVTSVNGEAKLALTGTDTFQLVAYKFAPSGFVGNLVLGAKDASITLCTNGNITTNAVPTLTSSIATKGYVDSADANFLTISQNHTSTQIAAAMGPLTPGVTVKSVFDAINNDLNYYVNTNATMALKAPIQSAALTGTPTAPTPPPGDVSTRIATTTFVRNIFAAGTLGPMIITGPIEPAVDLTIPLGSPTKRFTTIYGTTVMSRYADLAEKYMADTIYRVGTVVVFGGSKEITVSDQPYDHRIAGVVSLAPAVLMNDDSLGTPVALTGKVPCQVVGPVKKGDVLVQSQFVGTAMALPSSGQWKPGCVIGKSLEDNDEEGIRDVLVVVGRF